MHEIVNQVPRIKVAEQSDAAANHGIAGPAWLPGQPESGLEYHLLDIGEGTVQARGEQLVKWRVRIMGYVGEVGDKSRDAIVLADLIRVSVAAQSHGQLQVRGNPPFVLEIQAETIDGCG